MISLLYRHLDVLLGLSRSELTFLHMFGRALLIYLVGIIVLNLINKRFLGEKTPFDILLRFIIGSSLANAITGSSPYFPTVGMVLGIILLNWLLSYFTLYNSFIDKMLKGSPVMLYKDGDFQQQAMQRHHFTQEDIMSEVRKDVGLTALSDVQEVILENSGEISVIPKKKNSKNSAKHEDIED